MANLSVALTSARTWLNDDAGTNWTDSALIPKCQDAHRELQTLLWNNGSPLMRVRSSAIPIVTGVSIIPQPADLLTPIKIQEFASADFEYNAVDMTERNFLNGRLATPTLDEWMWQDGIITCNAASADRKVLITYRRLITVPAASGDAIGIPFGELYIGPRAAAIANGSTSNKDAYEIMTQVAKDNFQLIIAAQRGQQSPPIRP